MYSGIGTDTVNGGGGNDSIYSVLGVKAIDGGAGYDTLEIDRSAMTLDTSFFLNSAAGSDGTTAINIEQFKYFAGSGADTVVSGTGDDYIDGGAGADTPLGGGGDDELHGQNGNDTLTGAGATIRFMAVSMPTK